MAKTNSSKGSLPSILTSHVISRRHFIHSPMRLNLKSGPLGTTTNRSSERNLTPSFLSLLLHLIILLNANLILSTFANVNLNDLSSGNGNNNADTLGEVSLCEACKLVVKSFEKGIDETSRGKHEGGDTSWEERNLKSYADSEVRLIEIQENLCEEVKKGKAQCLSLVEDAESDIEDWWFNHRNKNVRLNDYLCINKLKRCCPDGRFGPSCQPCPSNCNNHGLCDGYGTRLGTGECNCEPGYIGPECEDCAEDHYRIPTKANEQFTCRECDLACKGCFGLGPTNCTDCRQGFYRHEVNGCVDINECDVSINDFGGDARLCKGNTYCENTNGGYKCTECHRSCSGCIGYGPNMCLSCSLGYRLDQDHICRSKDELERQEQWDMERAIKEDGGSTAIYFIYLTILAVSLVVFGWGTNIFVIYTFVIGSILFLLISEFDILDEHYSLMSSE